jgi:hypothetical protein
LRLSLAKLTAHLVEEGPVVRVLEVHLLLHPLDVLVADSVAPIEAPERGCGELDLWVLSVEENDPLLERQVGPISKDLLTEEELAVLLLKPQPAAVEERRLLAGAAAVLPQENAHAGSWDLSEASNRREGEERRALVEGIRAAVAEKRQVGEKLGIARVGQSGAFHQEVQAVVEVRGGVVRAALTVRVRW